MNVIQFDSQNEWKKNSLWPKSKTKKKIMIYLEMPFVNGICVDSMQMCVTCDCRGKDSTMDQVFHSTKSAAYSVFHSVSRAVVKGVMIRAKKWSFICDCAFYLAFNCVSVMKSRCHASNLRCNKIVREGKFIVSPTIFIQQLLNYPHRISIFRHYYLFIL